MSIRQEAVNCPKCGFRKLEKFKPPSKKDFYYCLHCEVLLKPYEVEIREFSDLEDKVYSRKIGCKKMIQREVLELLEKKEFKCQEEQLGML